jgi:hypothetical protein
MSADNQPEEVIPVFAILATSCASASGLSLERLSLGIDYVTNAPEDNRVEWVAVHVRSCSKLGRKALILVLSIGLVGFSIFFLLLSELPRRQQAARVDHTLEAQNVTTSLAADLVTVITEARGFMLDGGAGIGSRFGAAALQVSQ